MKEEKKSKKGFYCAKISAFQLAMLTVAYVASVRALAMMSEYGFSSLFYYLLAALMFLLPSALVSAELATAWPDRGGVYVWVKEALGGGWGFLAIWLQFLTNVVNLPAFLSFLAATAAYIFMPQLANNKYFLISFILVVFWGSTFISFLGMKTAGWLNTFGAITGTLVPLSIILILSMVWLGMGHKSQIVFSFKTFLPDFKHMQVGNLVFLAGLLYAFTGMETSGAHALDVENTRKNYPRGIFLATIIISLVGLGAVAIAIVVPAKNVSLIAGIMQAFTVFLTNFHLGWAVPILAFLIVAGAIGCLNSSIIGPSKGFFGAASGGEIPPILTKVNKHCMPVNMFIFQGIVVTIITMLFLLMPTINSSYWLIADTVTIIYLLMYILLFISAIVLRYKRPDAKRAYKIPGGNWGMWIVAGFGLISSVFGIVIGFFPPSQFKVGNILVYEAMILTGILFFLAVGFLIYIKRKPHWVIDIDV
jgi:glutamate:GABA antiporter